MRQKNIFEWHIWFQYSARCTGAQVSDVIVPFQQQYIDEIGSGLMSRPGNGGFLHSCLLGAYWNTQYKKADMPAAKAIWQILEIGGVSMQQAISGWWGKSNTTATLVTKDCLWNVSQPGYFCNDVCNGFPYY